jgi:hypothetical protein
MICFVIIVSSFFGRYLEMMSTMNQGELKVKASGRRNMTMQREPSSAHCKLRHYGR